MREYERLQSTQEKFIHDLHYKSKSMLDVRNDEKLSLVVMSPEPSSVRFSDRGARIYARLRGLIRQVSIGGVFEVVFCCRKLTKTVEMQGSSLN
jgi:hypothetical protein